MPYMNQWPSGIRDTTEFPSIDLRFDVSLREHLKAFCKMDGVGWNAYDEQNAAGKLSVSNSRLRTFRKLYEKLGLIYKENDKICLSRLGKQILTLEDDLNTQKGIILNRLRETAIDILSRYQLRNPVDEPDLDVACDVLPCICIWNVMLSLDKKINYEEMNRVILRIMKMSDLDAAIKKIRDARNKYGTYTGIAAETLDEVLGAPVHTDQPTARIAPWFSFAGWGGLIIEQQADAEGYRNLNKSSIPLIEKVLKNPPAYYNTNDKEDWLTYYIGSAADSKDVEVPGDPEAEEEHIDYDSMYRIKCGCNILLYGVPGCGKSFAIDTCYAKDAFCTERVVFHPDYTYADFIGQIMPLSREKRIEYEFVPGPFTNIVREAYTHPDKKFVLVIEELNRGNAPAIFGDIFQLLDRNKDGSSRYEITNKEIASIVYKNTIREGSNKVFLPSNLCIYSTMNTSDQNVFTLDTAFQRRWRMRIIENNVDKSTIANNFILDTSVTWAKFNKAINAQILTLNMGMTSTEDKRLGAYFVIEEDLEFHDPEAEGLTENERLDAIDKNQNFPEKVLKYLWDDAFKFTRDQVFKEKYDSLEKVIKDFETAKKDTRFDIFLEDLFGLQN
ncbi:GTPase subunit of restriction endonuclease [Clostridium sp. ASBs410]|nr:GTPase subunit of restriction endonuclease [Clostridium sp. ASBs410]